MLFSRIRSLRVSLKRKMADQMAQLDTEIYIKFKKKIGGR